MAAVQGAGRPKAGYRNAAGESVPGVTTIIGRFKESGPLLHWAFAQGKLAEQGKIAHLYDARDKAADAGTLAHDLIEAHIHKRPTKPLLAAAPEPIREKAANAFEQFKGWAKMTRLKVLATELPLVSEQYQFGGTIDAVAEIAGKAVLLDWKTSNGVYADYLLQLAAYQQLLHECTEYRVAGGFHLLRVAKENADFAHHHWGELDDAWRAFVLYREAFDIDKRLKKRAA